MIMDGLLLFTGSSNGASGGIEATALADAPTTGTQVASNILDVGINDGVPSSAQGGGGRDMGIGCPTKLLAEVIVAFTSGTSLQLQLDVAPDNGSGAPGSYEAIWLSPAIVEADLDVGAQIGNIDLPTLLAGVDFVPRYYRLSFISAGTHVTGQIVASLVLDRMDQIRGTNSVLSGYRPGLAVAN